VTAPISEQGQAVLRAVADQMAERNRLRALLAEVVQDAAPTDDGGAVVTLAPDLLAAIFTSLSGGQGGATMELHWCDACGAPVIPGTRCPLCA
jgi:hypothetical protein